MSLVVPRECLDHVLHAHDIVLHAHDIVLHAHDIVLHAHDIVLHAHDIVLHAHDIVLHVHMTLCCICMTLCHMCTTLCCIHVHDIVLHAHDIVLHVRQHCVIIVTLCTLHALSYCNNNSRYLTVCDRGCTQSTCLLKCTPLCTLLGYSQVPYFLEYKPGRLFLSGHRGPGVKTRPAYKRGRRLFPFYRSRCALFQRLLWRAR